jgi:hypothetical protein
MEAEVTETNKQTQEQSEALCFLCYQNINFSVYILTCQSI